MKKGVRKKGREGGRKEGGGRREGGNEGRREEESPTKGKGLSKKPKIATYYDFATLPKGGQPEAPFPLPQTSTAHVVCVS